MVNKDEYISKSFQKNLISHVTTV